MLFLIFKDMNKKNIIITILILVIIALFVLLNFDKEQKIIDKPIKIGAPTSLTGVAAAFGEMAQMGMEMAVEEINADGGINDRPVELYIEDDQTSASTVVSAYQKLVGVDSVDVIIGVNLILLLTFVSNCSSR